MRRRKFFKYIAGIGTLAIVGNELKRWWPEKPPTLEAKGVEGVDYTLKAGYLKPAGESQEWTVERLVELERYVREHCGWKPYKLSDGSEGIVFINPKGKGATYGMCGGRLWPLGNEHGAGDVAGPSVVQG